MNSAEGQFSSCRANGSLNRQSVAAVPPVKFLENELLVGNGDRQSELRGVRVAENCLATSKFTIDQLIDEAGRKRGYA
jgi:hypothetical protein